jgi:hypothetical protein
MCVYIKAHVLSPFTVDSGKRVHFCTVEDGFSCILQPYLYEPLSFCGIHPVALLWTMLQKGLCLMFISDTVLSLLTLQLPWIHGPVYFSASTHITVGNCSQPISAVVHPFESFHIFICHSFKDPIIFHLWAKLIRCKCLYVYIFQYWRWKLKLSLIFCFPWYN